VGQIKPPKWAGTLAKSIIKIENRKLAHWRDCIDSLAAWNALTPRALKAWLVKTILMIEVSPREGLGQSSCRR